MRAPMALGAGLIVFAAGVGLSADAPGTPYVAFAPIEMRRGSSDDGGLVLQLEGH